MEGESAKIGFFAFIALLLQAMIVWFCIAFAIGAGITIAYGIASGEWKAWEKMKGFGRWIKRISKSGDKAEKKPGKTTAEEPQEAPEQKPEKKAKGKPKAEAAA